jgi:hypothetical protein
VESAPPRELAISPRGTRIATAAGRQVSVYELEGGRLLARHTFGDSLEWPATPVFRDEDRVRLLVSRYLAAGKNALEVYDLDLASRQLVGLATLPNLGWRRSISPDANRIAYNRVSPPAVAVFDLPGGRQLSELRQPGAKVRASYLADGRLAMQVAGPAGTEVTILDGDGRQLPGAPRFRLQPGAALGWFRIPTGATVGWIVQADEDRLLIKAILQDRQLGPRASWQLLDLRQGGMRPLGPRGLQLLPPAAFGPAGSAPLFSDGTRLLRIDLATGEPHALGPARQYRSIYLDAW